MRRLEGKPNEARPLPSDPLAALLQQATDWQVYVGAEPSVPYGTVMRTLGALPHGDDHPALPPRLGWIDAHGPLGH